MGGAHVFTSSQGAIAGWWLLGEKEKDRVKENFDAVTVELAETEMREIEEALSHMDIVGMGRDWLKVYENETNQYDFAFPRTLFCYKRLRTGRW